MTEQGLDTPGSDGKTTCRDGDNVRLDTVTHWKCCECCDEGAESGECGFNGRRDCHVGPCEECDPIGHAAWMAAQPERRSDVPF